jgi:hypothetical protein
MSGGYCAMETARKGLVDVQNASCKGSGVACERFPAFLVCGSSEIKELSRRGHVIGSR